MSLDRSPGQRERTTNGLRSSLIQTRSTTMKGRLACSRYMNQWIARMRGAASMAKHLTRARPGSERRAVARGYIFDGIGLVAPGVVARQGNLRYLVGTKDQFVGRTTFSRGDFDADVMGEALRIVASHLGTDPLREKVFVDVGANIGTSSVPALAVWGACSALAIEPEPENFRLLQCNMVLNDLADRMTCIRVAVAKTAGPISMELSAQNSGDHRIRVSGDKGAMDEGNRAVVEVPAMPLDSILHLQGVDPHDVGLLWIDTQGFEGQVLDSATNLLATGVPTITEYWPYGARRAKSLDLFHALVSKHYSTVVDVRTGAVLSADRVGELEREYQGRSFTDLALLKG